MSRSFSVVAAAALGLVACSLIYDVSDYGGTAAVTADAAAPDADGADSGRDDAAPPDAGDAACDFCDDFDDGVLGAKWTTAEIVGDGKLAIDLTTFVSPPRSMRAGTDAGVGGNTRAAMLTRTLPVTGSISCSFRVRFDSSLTGPNQHVDVFEITLSGLGVQQYVLRFGALGADFSNLREDIFPCAVDTCPRKSVNFPPLPQGLWRKITLSTDFKSATLLFDDVQVHTGAWVGFAPTNLTVKLGVRNFASPRAEAALDDLRCDLGDGN